MITLLSVDDPLVYNSAWNRVLGAEPPFTAGKEKDI